MAETGKSKTCVWRWQERFMQEGVDGLLRDRSRPPGKAPVSPARVAEIVRLTQEPPPFEATRWTLRTIAKVAGIAASTFHAMWKAHEGTGTREPRTAPGERDIAQGISLFCDGGARPPVEVIVKFIDEHRGSTGSSRSATFCRSPLPPIMTIWPSAPIRRGCQIVPNGMRHFGLRSSVSSRKTGASTAFEKSGDSCAARVSMSLAARLPG